jgi:putative ABC transport system permease protein
VRLFTLVRKSLFEKKLRTFLLAFGIAIAFFIYGLLAGFLATLDSAPSEGSSNELMVTNRVNVAMPLPISYRDKIAAIKDVSLVAQASILIGTYKGEQNTIPALMIEPESFLALISDRIVLAGDQRDAFLRARDGLLVDRRTATRWGWRLGDAVTLTSRQTVSKSGSRDWQFRVAGIFDQRDTAEPIGGVFVHYSFVNDNLAFGADGVQWFTVKTTSADANDAVANAIDSEFANSYAETKTQPAQAFARAFLAQLADIQLIVTLVVAAGFVTSIFVVGNTVALTVRQRRKQIATLKTLGFSPRHVLSIVIGESMLLSVIGGVLGLAAASVILAGVQAALTGRVRGVGLPAEVWLSGAAMILLLGIATGLIPALSALRVKAIDGLSRS